MTTKKIAKPFVTPPRVMNGSRVLYYSRMPRTVLYSGKISIRIGGKEIGRVPRLLIAEPLREKGVYLFHCRRSWNVISSDGIYKSVSEAKRQAELMYPGVTETWRKVAVSKRQARAIERRMWRGHECSFCSRIPPEFQTSLYGKNARICNICVDETYQTFLESEELASAQPPRGDYFTQNGFDHVAPYISRLLAPKEGHKYLLIFTPDRTRGFGMIAYGTVIQASFVMEPHQQSQEEKIRAFFASRAQRPSRDYLANNGRSRILQYPIHGTARELTATTKRILQDLCDIAPKEALSIRYGEKVPPFGGRRGEWR